MNKLNSLFMRTLLVIMLALFAITTYYLNTQNQKNRITTDIRCSSLGLSGKNYDNCNSDQNKYISNLSQIRASSKLTISKLKLPIPLRKKWPIFSETPGEDVSYYLDERLLLDTGAGQTVIFSTDQLTNTKSKDMTAAFGNTKTFAFEKGNISGEYFSVKNALKINTNDANRILIFSKFKGYLGLDFLVAMKTVCLDIEHGQISSTCFQAPDHVGRILVIKNNLLYIPIRHKSNLSYALIDTGYGISTYYSKSCEASKNINTYDAFGTIHNIGGEIKTIEINIGETTIKDLQVFCAYDENDSKRIILGSNFFLKKIKSIEFNFEDNTFSITKR